MDANQVIEVLNLEPLTIEGGMFNESYRSKTKLGSRSLATCIYYLMRKCDISRWHKVNSDEIWLYHCGCPAKQVLLYPDGSWEERTIGADLDAGERPQSIIPAGTWQAAILTENHPDQWGLFSATVHPGFEYSDLDIGFPAELMNQWPEAADTIKKLHLDRA